MAVAEKWIRLFFKVRKEAEPKWNTLAQRVTARLLTTKKTTYLQNTEKKQRKKQKTKKNSFECISIDHLHAFPSKVTPASMHDKPH